MSKIFAILGSKKRTWVKKLLVPQLVQARIGGQLAGSKKCFGQSLGQVLMIFTVLLLFLGLVLGSPLLARNGSDCSESHASGTRKMDEEKKKNEERRKETYPDPDETTRNIEDCLGGIGSYPGPGGFPPMPDIDEVINGVCREARRRISQRVGSYNGYVLPGERGLNQVRPGLAGEEIWNALQ